MSRPPTATSGLGRDPQPSADSDHDAPPHPQGDVVEPDEYPGQLQRLLGVARTFVPPATLLATLLFYFGYVWSRAQYRYFGLEVDAVGLGTREFVMRSPPALLAPLLVLGVVGTGLLVAHLLLRRRGLSHKLVARLFAAAVILITAGLVLLLGHRWFGAWPPYALVTPLTLAAGVGLAVYALRWPEGPLRRDIGKRELRPVRDGATALAYLVVAACLLWATATVAEWSGRGAAMRLARNLDQLPLVILDTQERLYLTDGVVRESELPAADDQQFRYRYRNLRLLLHGNGRLFLVPDRWTASNSTIVVPFDGSVRVQFRFVNHPP